MLLLSLFAHSIARYRWSSACRINVLMSACRLIFRPLPGIRLFRSLPLQGPAAHRSGCLSVLKCNLAVHDHTLHSFSQLGWLRISGFVDDGAGVKDRDVGKEAFFDQAAASEMFTLGGQGSNLPDGLLQRQ